MTYDYCEAAVLEKQNHPLVIKKLKIPNLLYGQVLVKIMFSGLCRSQLMEVNGGRGEDKWLPHLLGHEGSGVVVKVGPGVSKVVPGDEVVLTWIKSSGIEALGAKYISDEGIVNAGRVTTLSNYSVVSESRTVIKPKNLPFDTAVLFGCALPTGAGMVINELQPKPGSSLIVLGLGGIGMSALLAALASQWKSVVAVDVSDEKLKFANRMGCEYAINSKEPNFREKVLAITEGGADYCIESCGQIITIELGFSLINKNHGKLLFASHPPDGEKICLSPHELISGKQILGSWGGASSPDKDIPLLTELFDNSSIQLSDLLSKRYTLDKINEAIDDLEKGVVFRPIIQMQHS